MTNQPPNIIIYNTADGKASVALYARDGKILLKYGYTKRNKKQYS